MCSTTQSCPTLCSPVDCSLPGSFIHGIFQAGILEWVAISFSRGSSSPRDQTCVSCIADGFFTTAPPGKPFLTLLLLLLSRFSRVRLCATPETAAPPSLGFSRQEHWSGLPFLSHFRSFLIRMIFLCIHLRKGRCKNNLATFQNLMFSQAKYRMSFLYTHFS